MTSILSATCSIKLTSRDGEAWADWQDISPTAEWLAEIYSDLEVANTFLFVINPDSATSDICGLETEHAFNPYKQTVPVVWKATDDVHEVCQLRIGPC